MTGKDATNTRIRTGELPVLSLSTAESTAESTE
jgi:hypothetical protein